ncbi:MAG: 7-carboxy-7-deazaguanine synthase QueE [Campylobacterota bacterium]|nr:7-carboxy-7-deazaguanine synthase QueE [Campylobacterota bacterium]
MIYLVEHFFSIQGEGKYTGVPSLFFRFGGCNMRCEGFGCKETAPDGVTVPGCDTVYAVDKQHFGAQWQQVTELQQLIDVLESYELPKNVDVVLTGGEPLIYADNPLFAAFLQYLIERDHRVTFETNGAMPVNFTAYPVYRKCIYALSVKLSNSGEPYAKRVKPDIFIDIASHARESFFKFTVDQAHIGSELEKEIEEIVAYVPHESVYCMPLGGSKTEVEANTEAVIEFCKRKGYRYSDRLHIRIWDQNKGV